MKTRTLYFFRHGLTDWNQQRRLQGHTDIPLNQEGRDQALSLQDFFQQNPVQKVFSSDLGRAVETASLATGFAAEKIIRHAGLKEARLGDLEGLREEEITARFGPESLLKWRSLEPEDRNYAFPGGESREQCNQRFHRALLDLCKEHPFTHAAVCSHGFAMRRLFHFFSGEKTIPPLIANCVIYQVRFEESSRAFHVLPPTP